MGAVEDLFKGNSAPTGGLSGSLSGLELGKKPDPLTISPPNLEPDVTGLVPPPPARSFAQSPVGHLRQEQAELENDAGGLLAQATHALGHPIKGILDLIGNLDRPQQFLFGAITGGLESGSFTEGIETGVNAAIFRRPTPGGPKRRVEPREVIDSVAKHVFGKEKFSETMHPAARFSLEMGVLLGADPLLLIPGVWYAKAGQGIKRLHMQLASADKARMTVTKGQSIEHIGHVISRGKIEKELAEVGARDGILDFSLARVSEDLTDPELALVRDYLTGVGAEGVVGQEIAALLNAGDISPNQVGGLLERMTGLMDEVDADRISGAINQIIAAHRNTSNTAARYLLKGNVSTGKGSQVVSMEMLAGEGMGEAAHQLLAGQLINRFGLDPRIALNPKTLSAARKEIGRQARGRVAALGRKGERLAPFASAPKKTHLTSPISVKLGRGIEASVDPISGQAFLGNVLEAVGKGGNDKLLEHASKEFRAAAKRSISQGPFVVDAVVQQRVAQRFRAAGLTSQSAREFGEFMAGTRKAETISDLPDAASHFDVAASLLKGDHRTVKDMSLLGFMFDPKAVLPSGLYELLKFSDDTARTMGNAINDHFASILQVGGKPLARGSEESKMITMALHYDPVKKTGDLMSEAWKKQLGMTSKEAYEKVIADEGLGAVYHNVRAFYDGAAEKLTRMGQKGFEKGAPVAGYHQRVYPNLTKSVEEGIELGFITEKDGAGILARANKDPLGFLSPQELDHYDSKSIWWQQMADRTLDEPLPGMSLDLIEGLNSYTMGFLRKVYTEPAIRAANQLGTKLPRTRKRYLNLLMKRMRGAEIVEEELLNSSLNIMRERFFMKPTARPATRAALTITRQFYRGLLGGNLGFFLKNMSQGINTAVEQGPMNFMRGASMLVANPVVDVKTGMRFRDVVSSRNLLTDFKSIMEKNTAFGKTWVDKFDDVIFQPAHMSEYLNRGIAFGAGMTDRMRKGGFATAREMFENPDAWADAIRYGHAIANETQFIYGVLGRSPVAGSPIGRMGLQFFSWPVKQYQFIKNGIVDEGAMFMMRFTLMSGMFSKAAEHAEVDAGSFTGFGFMPSQASPTFQAATQMFLGVEAAAIQGDTERSRKHFAAMATQLENLVPVALQLTKMAKTAESIETGVQRSRTGDFQRRTDDPNREQPLSQVLDATINPLNRAMGLPELSGEQAVGVAGLPSKHVSEFRETSRKMSLESQAVSGMARRIMEDYIQARNSGDFRGADKIRAEAFSKHGIFLSPEMINRELLGRQEGAIEQQIGDIRRDVRNRIASKAYDENPELMRHAPGFVPLPPTALDGTRP